MAAWCRTQLRSDCSLGLLDRASARWRAGRRGWAAKGRHRGLRLAASRCNGPARPARRRGRLLNSCASEEGSHGPSLPEITSCSSTTSWAGLLLLPGWLRLHGSRAPRHAGATRGLRAERNLAIVTRATFRQARALHLATIHSSSFACLPSSPHHGE